MCSAVSLLLLALTLHVMCALWPLQEQLVRREHRKETLRAKKKEEAALQKAGLNKDLSLAANRAGGEGQPQQQDEEGEGGPHRVETITYCAIDYPRLVDMLTYRLAVMAQKAKVGAPVGLGSAVSAVAPQGRHLVRVCSHVVCTCHRPCTNRCTGWCSGDQGVWMKTQPV
jgi:hypothetical protein